MTKQKNKILIFLGLYFIIKIFSYFFSPDTPLYLANPINTFISTLILLTTIYLLIKKNNIAWLIIVGEIILGGGGGYFQVLNISLRTLLLLSSISIYALQNIRLKNKNLKIFSLQSSILIILLLWACISSIIGYFNNHNLHLIYSDLIPYFYLLYLFPLRELIRNENFKQTALSMFYATIVGNTIFILFTFFGFSFGWFELQDAFYHWYRDVALGKITAISTGFFRLTLDEHLMLIPVALFFINKTIKDQLSKINYQIPLITYSLLLIVLSINITRIYLVALFIGYLFIFTKQNWKKWFEYGLLTGAIFLISFCSLNIIATRGESLGFELLGLRLGSVVAPQIEESSMSRILLLKPIWEKIKTSPVLGEGLGATISAYSPIFKETITTSHFDWGWLEIIVELGVIGLFIWLLFLTSYILKLITKYKIKNTEVKISFLSILIALLIINTTSPALFHSLGIIFIVFIFSQIDSEQKEKKLYDFD